MRGTLLIIDDDRELAGFLGNLAGKDGFDVAMAHTATRAREIIVQTDPDIVLLDIRLPDADGVELFKELKQSYSKSQFIMMTAYASVRAAIDSIRMGALDYLVKPFDPEEMLIVLQNALKSSTLKEEIYHLRTKRLSTTNIENHLEYSSPAMRKILGAVNGMAQGNGTIMLTGESGSGKNHLAGLIHQMSPRSDGPFFDINCAALNPSLVESELFGHEPGSFTGAGKRKRGLLELAESGTLFLDEIGSMEFSLQSRLLTFLDTYTLRRIGGEKNIKVNTRVVAATNQNLNELVRSGKFREDLYYRLDVLSLRVPSLRERKEDIPLIIEEIYTKLARNMGLKQVPQMTDEALAILRSHDWPGNVRELRNVLERALMLATDKKAITAPFVKLNLDSALLQQSEKGQSFAVNFPSAGISMKKTVSELTKRLVEEALERTKTKKDAAALLSITVDSLAYHIKSLGIER